MASNPLFIIPDFFFCILLMNFAMATLGLKEMGKLLWEGREKVLPIGCLSLVSLDAMPLSLKNLLLNIIITILFDLFF